MRPTKGKEPVTTTRKPDPICDEPGHTRTLAVDETIILDSCDAVEIIRGEPDDSNDTGLIVYSDSEVDYDDDDPEPVLLIECFDCFIENYDELTGPLETAARDGAWFAPGYSPAVTAPADL